MNRNTKNNAKIKGLQKSPNTNPEAKSKAETTPVHDQQSREPRRIMRALDASGEVLADITTDPEKLAGTPSLDVARMVIEQSVETIPKSNVHDLGSRLEAVCKSLEGLNPQTTLEGLLCAQMIGTHNLAMEFMRRSLHPQQTVETFTAQTDRAVRLMRMFVEQADALQKLRGKAGQQTVTVEHVHVHQGGQAIVGAVGTGPAGGVGDGSGK